MPTTFTEVLSQGKNKKRPCLEWTPIENPTGYAVGHLTIHNDRDSTEYEVQQFPADECRGICLAKKTPGTDKSESHYCLTVGPGNDVRCECKSFVRWSKCKHRDSVIALLENGWL